MNAQSRTIANFWDFCRTVATDLPVDVPDAWAFGASPEQAERLLQLVLDGVKTATASALWDYEADGESVPEAGSYSVVLDGRDQPKAVIQTTGVNIVAFDEVTAAHAYAEGEGDRTLQYWRDVHERFWRAHAARGFDPQMPVVCEQFRLVYPTASATP